MQSRVGKSSIAFTKRPGEKKVYSNSETSFRYFHSKKITNSDTKQALKHYNTTIKENATRILHSPIATVYQFTRNRDDMDTNQCGQIWKKMCSEPFGTHVYRTADATPTRQLQPAPRAVRLGYYHYRTHVYQTMDATPTRQLQLGY